MLVYEDKELEKYKADNLGIKQSWNERNFTDCVREYFDSSTEKVLAVGGLRGTGKTVGILQAAAGHDVCYITAQVNEKETGVDYIHKLENTEKKYIILDEYGGIRGRDELDRYLLTCLQNGKRIVITGTESITLEFLNYGALNHRVTVLHTTMFTYDEYRRIYGKEHSKSVCRDFLMEGGLFREYALRNFDSMKTYIEEAIVRNLSGYLKKEMDMETARTLTYSVLYKAVCPSNLSRVPTLNSSHATLHNFLDRMGVNTELEIKDFELDRVSEIFEQIGLITRVPNYDTASSLREQYYISNPSLTCQLILVVYGLRDIDSSVLGHVYESCVMTQLAANKLEEHDIYFLNSENHDDGENNMELDAVVTDRDCEFVYLFECKFAKTDKIHPGATLLSGRLEKNYFQESEIVGRYVVYNGRPCVKEYDIGTVVFTPMGDMLDRYFEFSDNVHELVEIEDE